MNNMKRQLTNYPPLMKRGGIRKKSKMLNIGTFLMVQWLRFNAFSAGGMGSIPGWDDWCSQTNRKTRKQMLNMAEEKETRKL